MKKIIYAAVALMLTACGGNVSSGESASAKDGLSGKVHKVQTLIYNAKLQGGEVVKDGKPDSYREIDFFPAEETRIYNENGLVDSIVSVLDASKTVTVFSYQDGMVHGEKNYLNGELITDRKYVYQDGKLTSTIEDMYIGQDKTTNEYPVDASKVKKDGENTIEYGYTENDYVVKDAQGRVLKESVYNEMDDYLLVKEYTYNDKGWLETCVTSDGDKVSYQYPVTDEKDNWTKMVISIDEQPYGIVERNITYRK